ncbi:hypothetical protein JTB14_003517 [Gonioctena quinquepunctata]|nr:hypothetical protein JTB14_003517 [Gonioctena quinquepunctata]
MCEVNVHNFEEKFTEIKRSLADAKFISIDLEFSALHPLKNQSPSLFDNPQERYTKLRKNLEHVIPVQLGLTSFNFDPDQNTYHGTIYNFYIAPASFPSVQRTFLFQSDTLSFLRFYGFDFNKFAYSGLPFINRIQEEELRSRLKNGDLTECSSNFKPELENVSIKEGEQVKKWYNEAKEGDKLSLPKIYEKYSENYETMYFIHKIFRGRFKNVWTAVENRDFVLFKVSGNDYAKLQRTHDLDEQLVTKLLGFTRVFRLLSSLRKPLVGHNLLQDIFLMVQSFETSLPSSYSHCKKLISSLFPTIFDTKHLSYELRNLLPEEKRWMDRGLESIFEHFKNGSGRHLAINSPAIEARTDGDYGKYHEAGWDSFCAGYIFIRLGFWNISQKYPKSKKFVSSELIAGLSEYKNNVNVIRGSINYIKIDGDDPVSTRPPFLVIESAKNGPLSIPQVSAILNSFGFVEIRKIPYQSRKVLVAVDNFGK